MRLYNTLSRKVEELQPLEPGVVRMYSCGPTVYRYAHLGNLRTYLMADWIRRALEIQGLSVVHVKNITDVGHMRQEMLEQGDDKVIAAALAEGKTRATDKNPSKTEKLLIKGWRIAVTNTFTLSMANRLGRLLQAPLLTGEGWLRRLPPPLSGWTRYRDFPRVSSRPFRARWRRGIRP